MRPVVGAALATGGVSREERDIWVAEQAWRAGRDRMFLAMPMFLAAARRR
ncbi:hypothetical protein [Microtetraspora niveoalba]|nr:hypothetical protein [Microtetraspora niveoalba]